MKLNMLVVVSKGGGGGGKGYEKIDKRRQE